MAASKGLAKADVKTTVALFAMGIINAHHHLFRRFDGNLGSDSDTGEKVVRIYINFGI